MAGPQDPPFFNEIRDDHLNGHGKTNGKGNGHGGNGHADKWTSPIVCEALQPVPITTIPPRPWAYGNFLLFGQASVIGAVDGGGKGALAVVIALAVITGRWLLGEKIWRTGRVAIVTYEDDQTEWRRRIAAASIHYNLDYEAICDSFYFISRPGDQIRFAAPSLTGVCFPDSSEIIEQLRQINAVLLIVDPFNRAHALEDGNSNLMITQVAAEISRIARESMTAALVLHHLRKGANGHADDLMGAVMLRATFRAARILAGMTADEAERLQLPPKEAWRYSRVTGHKENYAPPAEQSTWYKLESIDLGNGAGIYPDGDNVQVTTLADGLPDAFDGLERGHIAEILTALREGPQPGEFYAPQPNAENWAGDLIITVAGKDKAAATRILRTWIRNKVVLKDTYSSPKRRHKWRERLLPNETKAAEILGPLYRPVRRAT